MDPAPISEWSMAERKRGPIEVYSHAKKLRSNIPRRKRIPAIPIVGIPLNCSYSVEDEADSSSSCINSEVSIAADLEFTGYPKRPRSSCGVLRRGESAGSFQRGLSNELGSRRVETGIEPGVCCLSNSLTGTQRSEPTVSEGNADVEIAFSGVSEISGAFPGENLATIEDSSKATTAPELSESSLFQPVVSKANAAVVLHPSMTDNTGFQIETKTAFRDEEANDLDLESDLACPEHLLDGKECSDYSACNDMTISELESDLFGEISEEDSSDISLSDLIESPDEFSERSFDDSTPSIVFSLLEQLWEQFKQSSFDTEANVKFQTVNELSDEFISVRFPDRDDEESYQRFRSRERNEVSLHDYSEGYNASTEFGDLILGQRQLMAYWMLEQFQAMDLHHETLFLGVNLMDRFLSRGYFQTGRNLQLLGIACLTLAKRIEENQPYNSIRQKSFKVGDNVFKRCEVVSMEWLVLEVLSFKCFLPTTYNFLWFYLKAARASAEVEDLCRYLAILALLDHGSLCFWPSTVAAGLVILACLATDNDPDCDVVMETHVRSKADDLPECIKSFEWLVEYATSHR